MLGPPGGQTVYRVLARASILLAVAPSAPVGWWPGSRTLPDSVLRRLPMVVRPEHVTTLSPSGSRVVTIPVDGGRPVPSRRPVPPVGPVLAAAPWGEPLVPFAGVTVSTCQVPRQWLRSESPAPEVIPVTRGSPVPVRSPSAARDHHPVPAPTRALACGRRPASTAWPPPARRDARAGPARVARRRWRRPPEPRVTDGPGEPRCESREPRPNVPAAPLQASGIVTPGSSHSSAGPSIGISAPAPRDATSTTPPLRSPIRPSSGEQPHRVTRCVHMAWVPGRSQGCSHVLPIPRRHSASERSPSDDFGARPRAVTCSAPPMAVRRSWTSMRAARWPPVTSAATADG